MKRSFHASLDDVCALITDGTHYTPPDLGKGVPFLTVKDMNGASLDLAGSSKISEDEYERARAGNSVPELGDVLFSKDGTVGKVHVVRDSERFAVLSSIAILRPDNSKLDSGFLGWMLRTPNVLQQASKKKTGSALRRIILNDLRQVTIPLLPLPEQKRIAAILDKADGIRHKRQQAIARTEELLHSTFMRVVGPSADSYDRWPRVSVQEMAELKKGGIRSGPFGSALLHSEFVDSGVAVLGIDNAVNNRFEWAERRFITPEKYADLQRYTVYPLDVLITIMGTTGRSAVVPSNIPTAITTKHLAAITVRRETVEPEFLSHAIHMHPEVLRQISAANRGAIMSGLNLGLIKAIEFPLPPLPIQRKFVDILARVRSIQSRMKADSADHLFRSLSQRAFRGQL